MKPTIAFQVPAKDAHAQDVNRQLARDMPELLEKDDMQLFFEGMGAFCELDKTFRFRIVYPADANLNPIYSQPEIMDMATGAIIEPPTENDHGVDALKKLAVHLYACDKARKHKLAEMELRFDLRDQQEISRRQAQDRLFELAGYKRDANGNLTPVDWKFKELLAAHPNLVLDSLYGAGWKESEKGE